MDYSIPIQLSSVESIPGINARAVFSTPSSANVFREDGNLSPVNIDRDTAYIPWGADNQMPYDIISLIEKDETLATCQLFNAELCYGAGLRYNSVNASSAVRNKVADFLLDNDMPEYFLGLCQDFKHFGFAVSVIILNADASRIVRIIRKEACYCRFAPADENGHIPYILYANWRKPLPADNIEKIELLDRYAAFSDLSERAKSSKSRKFALISRVPTVDSTYYPIPHYAALFRSKWYDIKQLIATAKKSKLRNSAPIKYHIETSPRYWENIFRTEGITARDKQQQRVIAEKQQILDFLTGAENSGKTWFSSFYVSPDGKEQHDVVINKIESSKEGGDWETDIQEAINIFCFALRVHSNLVGSVPGKAQSNNSGSDKRELYTIAQSLQKPYHDILFRLHQIIIRFNGWHGVFPEIPFVQLTTLDEHRDAKTVAFS